MSKENGWRKGNVNDESEPTVGSRFSRGAAGQNNVCYERQFLAGSFQIHDDTHDAFIRTFDLSQERRVHERSLIRQLLP